MRRNNRARYLEHDADIFSLSPCVVDAGTPLPDGPFCRDCAHYIHGQLTANCRARTMISVGPLWNACHKFEKYVKPIEQNNTMEHNENTPTTPPATKVCPKCGRELPAEAFGRHVRTKDGLQPTCKECRRSSQVGKPRSGRPSANPKKTAAPAQAPVAENPSLSEVPDHDLVSELRRRGYDVKCSKTVEL